MPEKVDFSELRHNDLAEWFIVKSMTALSEHLRRNFGDLFRLVPGQPLEVSLTMNGVEVPFLATMHFLGEQLDRMVLEKAKEMVGEAADALRDEVYEVVRHFEHRLDGVFGPLIEEVERKAPRRVVTSMNAVKALMVEAANEKRELGDGVD